MPFGGLFRSAWSWVVGKLSAGASQLKEAALSVWDAISRLADLIRDSVTDALVWVREHVWGGALGVFVRLDDAAAFLGHSTQRVLKAIYDALARTAWWAGAKIWKASLDVIDWALDRLREVWETLTAVFNWVMDWGGALIDLLMDLTSHVARVLAAAVYRVADEVGDALDAYIDQHWDD